MPERSVQKLSVHSKGKSERTYVTEISKAMLSSLCLRQQHMCEDTLHVHPESTRPGVIALKSGFTSQRILKLKTANASCQGSEKNILVEAGVQVV